MVDLIAFATYRTESILIDGEMFTVTFSKRKDGEEFMLTAVGQESGGVSSCSYSAETAQDFLNLNGIELAETVIGMLARP